MKFNLQILWDKSNNSQLREPATRYEKYFCEGK